MNNELDNFLYDLIRIIQEKYNHSLNTDKDNNDFENGINFAYYDVLDIIETQLNSFGYEIDGLDEITPQLGKNLCKKKRKG